MPARETALQSVDGHAWTNLAVTPDAACAGLIWLPALGVPAAKYLGFAEALAGQGLATVIHEWRGTGSSSLRASRRHDWGYRELLLTDIPASIAHASAGPLAGPWLIGGHSLGGQLAAMSLALAPQSATGLVLIATGVPAAETYSRWRRPGIRAFARAVPPITRLFGYFPGDRLQWAGREAGRLMRDWASTIHRGEYRQLLAERDLDTALARVRQPTLGLRLGEDWLAPAASLQMLMERLGPGAREQRVFEREALGTTADHFRWMKQPQALARAIREWLDRQLL